MKYKKYSILLFIALVIFSCDNGFEELNITPDQPAVADVRAVYNGASAILSTVGTEQNFLRNELLFTGTQLTGMSRKLGVDPIERSRGPVWGKLYGKMSNFTFVLDELEKLEKETILDVTNAKAMTLVSKAFATLKICDLYGDIPFSEAGQGFITGDAQILRPVFDDAKTIYMECLDMLKWASDNIVEDADNTYLSFAGYDAYFGGNMLKWRKLANTLILRYAMRMSEKDLASASGYVADILNGGKPLLEDGEDFVYDRIKAGDRGRLSAAFRSAGSCGVRMGETIWHYMSENDSADGSGIYDPRIYLFFEPNMNEEWVAVSQDFEGGINPEDQADVYERKRILYSWEHPGRRGAYSPVNVNFVHSQTTRRPIVNTSEVYFLKAEAYTRGVGVTKNMTTAEENYYNGIKSSVNYWYEVAEKDISDQSGWKPAGGLTFPLDQQQIDDLVNHTNVSFTGKTDAEKLELIYGQRWVSLFWLPEEAHYLQRRTGQTPSTGAVSNFFLRMPYPDTEESYNVDNYNAAIAKLGSNSMSIKLWYMK